VARSIWKGPFVDGYLLKKVQDVAKSGSRTAIKTWSRRSTILPQFVGLNFAVHNGKKFIPVFITEEMVGQKLGEYSPTRSYYGHTADKKVKKG
jgi:small subunit ribosomal protein S19